MTQPPHESGEGPRETGAPPAGDPAAEEISGVENWLEEGGRLEPGDQAAADGAAEAPAAVDAEPGGLDESDGLARQLAERTADLQRLQAEYVNYKRRVDRDRDLVREQAVFSVLNRFLPILDDIDRAGEHGELEGGFKAVAESLQRTTADLGLVRFGVPGDEFDPNHHEALLHRASAEATSTTVDQVAQAGYRMGDRVVRAAKVTVVGPEE